MDEYRIGIVAHEKRRQYAEKLYSDVNADSINFDDGKLGCDASHKLMWTRLSEMPAQWSVLLEDDAAPAPDFRNQLSMALTASPEPIVSLYMGRLKPEKWQAPMQAAITEADTTGAHWITTNAAIHAVGIAIHTTLIPDLLKYWRDWLPADQAISSWTRRTNRHIAYTHPSLINHLDIPTVIKRRQDGMTRTPGRIAWHTGGHTQWNSDTIAMPNPLDTPRHQRQRSA
jgi:GR25 family glycosyltransferase involved in LPS biosynthesis